MQPFASLITFDSVGPPDTATLNSEYAHVISHFKQFSSSQLYIATSASRCSDILVRRHFTVFFIVLFNSRFQLPFSVPQCQVHDSLALFSRPSSYDTITRRFSSNPNLVSYFIQRRQQEAKDRGEFIDIHDIASIDPKDYDVLIKVSFHTHRKNI
jgi:hypothetical protein